MKRYKVTVIFDRLNSIGVLEKRTERQGTGIEATSKEDAKKKYLKIVRGNEPSLIKIHVVRVEAM